MPKVSLFDNIAEVKNPQNFDIIEYLELTRDGEWMDVTLDCRNLTDEQEQKAFKKTMPTCTLSGVFDIRRDANLKKHSEYLAMDLDNVPNLPDVKFNLKRDKYVFSVFLSTGAKGLRALFLIDPKKHEEAFDGITEYLFQEYGITCVDPNGRNPSKPYIVSWDPDLYINFGDVKRFDKYVKPIVIKRQSEYVHTTNDFSSILSQIAGRQIQIYDSYQEWLKIGFAFAHQFGEGGRDFFHAISQYWAKYSFKDCDKQYTYCIRHKSGNPATISTFYYLAKRAGVNISSEQTRIIIRSTKNGKAVGLGKKDIIANLKKFENIEGADNVVDQVFDSYDHFDDTDEETILHQLELYISNNYALKMNEVTGFLEQGGHSLSQSDLNTIFIAAKKMVPKLDYQLMMRLLKSDFIESYNPFYQFFGSDGTPVILPPNAILDQKVDSPLIDQLASCIKNDRADYTVFFLRKWMVGAVSAVHKVHSPLLLALLGAQNTGKTEFFRRLVPKELMSFYAESKLDKGKDDELLMTQYWFIMDDELGGKSKAESNKLKNITSTQYYYIRRPYGDHNEKILRLAVLCGTSNVKEILNDTTGNRRIIPVEVDDIDKELFNSIDKALLWKEAYRLYREGFDWRISQKDMPMLNADQDRYTVVSKEGELISKYFTYGTEKMLVSEIFAELSNLTHLVLSMPEVSKQMLLLGFERKTARDGLMTAKKWFVKRINRSQDVNQPPVEDLPF